MNLNFIVLANNSSVSINIIRYLEKYNWTGYVEQYLNGTIDDIPKTAK